MVKLVMGGKQLALELPDELYRELVRVGAALGTASPEEAGVIAIAEWCAQRGAELDDRDPSRRYFVNEALDELEKDEAGKKRG